MSGIPGTYRNRVLMVLPEIPDDAPDQLKNALAIRNACATEGRCPSCGAAGELELDRRGLGFLMFRHDDGCPCLRDDESLS